MYLEGEEEQVSDNTIKSSTVLSLGLVLDYQNKKSSGASTLTVSRFNIFPVVVIIHSSMANQ